MSFFSKKYRWLLFFLLLLVVGALGVLGKYWHFRKNFQLTYLHHPSMDPAPIEGYTEKYYYEPGDTVRFFLRSDSGKNQLRLDYLIDDGLISPIMAHGFGKKEQEIPEDAAKNGCKWERNFQFVLPDIRPGYLSAHLYTITKPAITKDLVFLVGDTAKEKEVLIFAPVSTWIAYNKWGGQSFYVNFPEQKPVYQISSQRPVSYPMLSREHSGVEINTEIDIFRWFSFNYKVTVVPDYFLETPERLPEAAIYVLSSHCEYISEKMYDELENAVENKGVSLISFGANQLYWKTKWNDDHTLQQCRKDLSFFSGLDYGGKWRHNFRSEDALLGVRFDDKGIGTFAPYKVEKADHWVFQGSGINNGDLFGEGKSSLYDPLSGNEMDKMGPGTPEGTILLAKGLNPATVARTENIIWPDEQFEWNGGGGGEITLRELDNGGKVLAFGSMQAGAGLGEDKVLTLMIQNFCDRVLKK